MDVSLSPPTPFSEPELIEDSLWMEDGRALEAFQIMGFSYHGYFQAW